MSFRFLNKNIRWIILAVILTWLTQQLWVTPWWELSGKLFYQTNRIAGKHGTANLVREQGSHRVVFKDGGLYGTWSPDGRKIAAFFGTSVVLIDQQGQILSQIAKPQDMLGMYLSWFMNPNRIMTIEVLNRGFQYHGGDPSYLFIYDFTTGERIPFYTKEYFYFFNATVINSEEQLITGHSINDEHEGARAKFFLMNKMTKEIRPLRSPEACLFQMLNDHEVAFWGPFRILGQLISPSALGVYNFKTQLWRYIDLFAGDIRQMTVAEGKYVITAEGDANGGVSLYKRSIWGGFKLPITRPEKIKRLNDFPSQDQYPDWHA